MQSTTNGGHSVSQTASNDKAAKPSARQSPNRSASAALLPFEQLARDVLRVSPRTAAELIKQPWMPRPIVLGPRLLRWSLAEVEAAIANMPRQVQPGAEPAQLRRQRIDRMKAGPDIAASHQ